MKKYIAIFTLIIIYSGCGNDDLAEGPSSVAMVEHFPLFTGLVSTYQIYQVIYGNAGESIDSLQFFLREEVVEDFIDGAGQQAFRLERMTSETADGPWSYRETYTATVTSNEVIRSEDNLRFIKMNLPPRKGASWDGNAYFDSSQKILVGSEPMDYFKSWQSVYVDVDTSVELDGRTYDNVHIVSHANHENKLELRYVKEYYARGFGLIYQELKILDTQCFSGCDAIPWEAKAEKGIIWIQTRIDSQ